jgi:hypothetical protein
MMRREIFVVACLLFVPSSFAQQQPKTSGIKVPPVLRQEMVVPYWTLEPGWHTDLEIRNNNATHPITVTPFLLMSSGDEVALPSVELAINEIKSINIGAAISGVRASITAKLVRLGQWRSGSNPRRPVIFMRRPWLVV